MATPGIVIAALRGGSGKTILSIGLIAALKKRGLDIAAFKKGPDYIDAGWLAIAAGQSCHNLDLFMIPPQRVLESFQQHSYDKDFFVVEGNRGLFDGIDVEGRTSTAALAKLIQAPVVLGLDCTKSTRTMAAIVLGCLHFDPELYIQGVILNRVAGARHERVLRQSIEAHCGVPVLGAVPKMSRQHFPERHMGLVPTPEHDWAADAIETVAQTAEQYLDIDALLRTPRGEPEPENQSPPSIAIRNAGSTGPAYQDHPISMASSAEVRIGIVRDSAFQFYYPENIEAIVAHGGLPIFISPLEQSDLPQIDALYIGGGFPETHARQLSENLDFRNQIRRLAQNGLPIYAECGGLMYLGESLVLEGRTYPMAGVLPAVYGLSPKPQGHGYAIARVVRDNPFFAKGTLIKGHEFHYSTVLEWKGRPDDLVFSMEKGKGFKERMDGVLAGNVLASYLHIHALGVPQWAGALIENARRYRDHAKSDGQFA